MLLHNEICKTQHIYSISIEKIHIPFIEFSCLYAEFYPLYSEKIDTVFLLNQWLFL